MTEDQIKHMVDRFLAWRLPEPFNPDNGISFTSPFADEPMRSRHWPIGTNLFDARQAEAMVRHLIEGLSQPPAPSPLEGEVQPMPDLEVLGEALFKLSARLKVSGFLDDDANHSAYGAVVAAFNAPSTLSTEAGSGEESEASRLRHKLWMVISHASGGHLSEEGDPDRSTNDICVEISRHHTRVWEQALEKGRKEGAAIAEAGKPAGEEPVKRIEDGHADTEGEAAEMLAHLNCPACGGSGHVDDAHPAPSDNQKMREVLAAIKVEAAAATSSDGKERDPWAIGRVLKMASAALAQSVEGGEG